jgi:AraC family transcriptional regulator
MSKARSLEVGSALAATERHAPLARRTDPGCSEKAVSLRDFHLRHRVAARTDFEAHSHTTLTVTSVLAGRLEATIGDKHFELHAGEAALTNAGETHAGRAFDTEFLSVGMSPGAIDALAFDMGLAAAGAEIVFMSTFVNDRAIISTAEALADELHARRPGKSIMLESLVRQMGIHLLRSHLTVRRSALIETSRAGPVDRRLRRAVEFMHDNFAQDLPLAEIAGAAYLSEYHFARLFKQIQGVTPHVFLANLRIEHARKLLLETSVSIAEVAAAVGYQSQSHFTKVFKAVTGLTPRAYREARH